MKRNDLDHAFNPTPHVFTNRVDAVLQSIKEDEPVKKFTLRTILITLVYTMLLGSIACAIVLTHGQEWYYNNRFTAYQENEPEKQQAIFEHLETVVVQEPSCDSSGLVDVTVQDYSWVPSQNLFTISFAARVKDSGSYELHSMMDMDSDGHWAPALDPKDKESRTEHWLSTEKGFGPPADVMGDPAKKLLLTDLGSQNILIGDSNVDLKTWCFDSFAGEDGTVIAIMEIDLMQSDVSNLESNEDAAVSASSADDNYIHPDDTGDDVADLQERLKELGYYNGSIDGIYSEDVRSAVMAFQEVNELVSDGVAGPATQYKLYSYEAKQALNSGAGDETQTIDILRTHLEQEYENVKASQEERYYSIMLANETIERYTDAEGMLTLRLPYQIIPFENGKYESPTVGMAVFKVKIR
jgi:hypothetical protein